MSQKINNLIKQAMTFFNQGKMSESKKIFTEIIQLDPDNFIALNAMGVVLGSEGSHKEAANFFFRALEKNPNNISVIFNLANSLNMNGDYLQALPLHEKANKLKPKNSEILMNYGKCLFSLKEYDKAITVFQEMENLKKNLYEVWFNIGTIKLYQELYDESLDFIAKAIAVDEKKPEPWVTRGRALLYKKEDQEAINSFLKAIELQCSNLDAVYNYISVAYLSLNNHNINAEYSKSIEYAKKALEINENNYKALNNLALSYIYELQAEKSVLLLEKAKSIKPDYYITFLNLGLAYKYLNIFSKAEENFELSLKFGPNHFKHFFNLGEVLLCQNKFSGWKYYENRKKKRPKRTHFSKPIWKPGMGYEKILIWMEQGIGDSIVFSSILTDLIKQFNKVYLLMDDRLIDIYKNTFPEIEMIKWSDEVDESLFDYHLSLCSLGQYFRLNIDDFTNKHLLFKVKTNPLFESKSKKFKCGISWGSINPEIGSAKSMSLEALKKIIDIDEIDFFSIQYDDQDNQIEEFNKNNKNHILKIPNLDVRNDLYGLSQFILSCDFVITISNSNAHLAAALGKPTFLLLSKGVGRLWYWENDHEGKNLWYPTIEKFEQELQGDWQIPINNLISKLQNMINS